MSSKKGFRRKTIQTVIEHLLRIFPKATDVTVKVEKDEAGYYESLIRVHGPQKKNLIAVKKASNYQESLGRSHQAIINQIHKLKQKKNRARSYLIEESAWAS